MCTYNGARFLQEQLDSIAAQTELPKRLAVVDDGSGDGSWELLQRWAEGAPFEVRLHRNIKNIGVVLNFARAVELLGDDIDLVFFSDQDDRWFPDKLSMFVDRFVSDSELGLLHSDADLIDANGKLLGRRLFETLLVTQPERDDVDSGRAWRVYAKRNLVTGAACAVRRSLLANALPFSPRWVHDEWLAFIASLASKVALISEPTMAYRLHDSNVVGMPIPTLAWRLRTTVHALTMPTAPRQLLRAERLHEMLVQARRVGASEEACSYLETAAAHAYFRGHLSRNPVRRASQVFQEWRRGHYHLWSNGEISMLHDLLIAR